MARGRTAEMLMTIAARFGGKAINLLVFLVVARVLALDELGLYGLIFSLAVLLTSGFDFGVRNSVAYFIGKQPSLAPTYVIQSLLLFLPFAVGSLVGLYLSLLFSPGELIRAQFLLPSGVLVVSMLFMRMQQGLLLGAGRIKFFNVTELASRVVLLGTTAVLFITGSIRLDTALWSLAISQLAASFLLLRGVLPDARGGNWRDTEALRALLVRGVLFMLGVLLMLVSKRLAIFLLSQLGSPAEVGLYFGLQRMTEILTEIGLAVAVVVFSSSVRAKSDLVAVDEAAHSTRISLAMFTVISAVMFAGADWLVPLALGDDFAGQANLFRVVLVGTLAGSVWTILFPSLSALTSPLLPIFLFLPHLAGNLVLMWVLFGMFGIMGAAWAMVVMNLGLTATFLIVFRMRYKVRIRDFLLPRRSDIDFAALARKLRRRGGAS